MSIYTSILIHTVNKFIFTYIHIHTYTQIYTHIYSYIYIYIQTVAGYSSLIVGVNVGSTGAGALLSSPPSLRSIARSEHRKETSDLNVT